MASTRRKNTPGEFCQFVRQNLHGADYTLYKNGPNGHAYDTRLPGIGLTPGQIPSNQFSANPTDIESFLFGVGANNMIDPKGCLTPELKCLQSANLFKMPDVIMPVPLVVKKEQRPFPVPN